MIHDLQAKGYDSSPAIQQFVLNKWFNGETSEKKNTNLQMCVMASFKVKFLPKSNLGFYFVNVYD